MTDRLLDAREVAEWLGVADPLPPDQAPRAIIREGGGLPPPPGHSSRVRACAREKAVGVRDERPNVKRFSPPAQAWCHGFGDDRGNRSCCRSRDPRQRPKTDLASD